MKEETCPTGGVDYRDLLVRYLAHVSYIMVQVAATPSGDPDFLLSAEQGHGQQSFTAREIEILRALSAR